MDRQAEVNDLHLLPEEVRAKVKIPRTLGEITDSALDTLRRRAAKEERPIALPWPTLNAHLGGGLWPGVHVLIGNTGAGKTQLALQVAHGAAVAGVPTAYVGLELDEAGLFSRLAALELRRRRGGKVHWSHLYLGECAPDSGAFRAVAALRDDLRALPFYSDPQPPMGWDYKAELPALAYGLHAAHSDRRPLIVVDFLQIVGDGDRGEELRERIGRAAYTARSVARTFDATIILVSSTARDNYGKLNGANTERPSDLPASRFVGLGKEAGEVEYAADSVTVLIRDDEREETFAGVAKVRARSSAVADMPPGEARRGWVRLHFDGTTFEEEPASVPVTFGP